MEPVKSAPNNLFSLELSDKALVMIHGKAPTETALATLQKIEHAMANRLSISIVGGTEWTQGEHHEILINIGKQIREQQPASTELTDVFNRIVQLAPSEEDLHAANLLKTVGWIGHPKDAILFLNSLLPLQDELFERSYDLQRKQVAKAKNAIDVIPLFRKRAESQADIYVLRMKFQECLSKTNLTKQDENKIIQIALIIRGNFNHWNTSLLADACIAMNTQAIKVLLPYAFLKNECHQEMMKALVKAILDNNRSLINSRYADRQTYLEKLITTIQSENYQHHIVRYHIDLIILFVKFGADVNQRDLFGKPILFKTGLWPEITRTLINAGANVNARHGKDFSIWDLYEKNEITLNMIKLCIESGLDVNAVSKSNLTPLMFMAKKTGPLCLEITQLLLEHGADASQTIDGQTALSIAQQHNNQKFIHLITKKKIP